MKKNINKFETKLNSLINESIKKPSINESGHNQEIMDFIDSAHRLFNKLKSDKTADKKLVKSLFTQFKPLFTVLNQLNSVDESINEEGEDDTVKIFINTYPWFFKKIDGTHFYMANNEKALKTGAAMAHHVGQHRGEDYYKALVSWLKGGIPTKKLNGKQFKGNG